MKKAVIFVLLAFSLALFAPAGPNEQVPNKTIDNLMIAFNGEFNANTRYMAFAKKAAEEGYAPVAALFRAAARAEQVHYEHHAAVIVSLGGKAKAEIEKPEVKTTRENVEAALRGETYEYTKMYPGFLAQAEADRIKDAVISIGNASEAEAVHARLFAGVLKDLEAWKSGARTFYVCPTCGNILEARPASFCPICGEPGSEFMAVK